ncbi:MAG: hypothetical protein M5U28_34020 [Sandaracinaceae bacterium]|nr:hypothetical protein [Sandaracinaceae bacterium]
MAKRGKQRARPKERSDAPPAGAPVPPVPPRPAAARSGRRGPGGSRGRPSRLAALATFARGVPSPLVATWDDGRFLLEFEPVQSVSLDHLRVIWTEVHFQAWHPLHLMAYWLDVPWAGPSGPVLHAVNLALWVLALSLALGSSSGLGLGAAPAVIAVLLYGLHPVQVEAVTWATGRKEILALTFACLAWLTHLDGDRYPSRAAWAEASGAARARLALRSAVPAVFYVLAAMSKTTVLPLPGLLFLGDVLLRREPLRRALARQIPILQIGAAFAAVVIGIWQRYEMIRPDAGGARSVGRAGLVAATFTHHVTTAAWPSSLSPVYPIDRSGEFGAAVWILPALYAGALALAWRAKAWRALFSLSATGVLLLPRAQLRAGLLPVPGPLPLAAAPARGLRRGRGDRWPGLARRERAQGRARARRGARGRARGPHRRLPARLVERSRALAARHLDAPQRVLRLAQARRAPARRGRARRPPSEPTPAASRRRPTSSSATRRTSTRWPCATRRAPRCHPARCASPSATTPRSTTRRRCASSPARWRRRATARRSPWRSVAASTSRRSRTSASRAPRSFSSRATTSGSRASTSRACRARPRTHACARCASAE